MQKKGYTGGYDGPGSEESREDEGPFVYKVDRVQGIQISDEDSSVPARIIINGEPAGFIRLPSTMALRDIRQRLHEKDD